ILNLNASGAVARLILQAKERRSDAASTAGAAEGEGEGGGETAETLLRDSVSSYQRALQMAEDNRTPGPVTGTAEITGSRTMLPPSTKKRLKQEPAGAQSSSRPAADPAPAAAATRHGTTATTAAFVELRKPLALSWEVELGPIVGGAGAEAGGGTAGAVAERETTPATPQRAEAVGGEPVVVRKGTEGKIAVEEDAEGGSPKDTVTTAVGENGGVQGRLGDGEAGGTSEGGRRGTITAASVGGGSFECRRVRVPTWARLVFADRKRILRIRVRPCYPDQLARHGGGSTAAASPAGAADRASPGENGGDPAPNKARQSTRRGDNAADVGVAVSDRQDQLGAATVPQVPNGASNGVCATHGCSGDAAEAAEEVMAKPGGVAEGEGGERHRPGTLLWHPRVCALQASSQAGVFEDVVRFSMDAPSASPVVPGSGTAAGPTETGCDTSSAAAAAAAAAAAEATANIAVAQGGGKIEDDDGNSRGGKWQEVVVPSNRSVRGREWRIVVETCWCHQGAPRASGDSWGGGGGGGRGVVQVAMEVELREAEVDADSLQMLHAAHNLLEVLDTVKERELLLPAGQAPPARTSELRQLVGRIKGGYVATAVGIHRSSRLQLQESGRASAEALRA
ncbi:unnamed protein product, partial [Ectocarpus sp. 8 AP-2014]